MLTAGLFLLLAACQNPAIVYNIESEEVISGSGDVLSIEKVGLAIRRGVISKTWTIKKTGENSFVAKFTKGKKIARVTIKYSATEYSIHYKSSARLSYDGSTIHRRYNAWIKGLRKNINRYLLLM